MTARQQESIREAFATSLVELGEKNAEVVVLDADMAAGTKSCYFRDRFPQRFFNVGIAEQNLINVAVGFALDGQIPFANTFAYLLALRSAEQVRTSVCYANANVKIAGGYGGLSGSMDGPTHHAITDLAVMRSMPNMTVVVVSDGISARRATFAVAEYEGPVYLRLSRATVSTVHDPAFELEIGKGVLLRPGNDITLVGTGVMVGRCLEAAELMTQEGLDARVIEIHTLKPVDREILIEAAEETGAIVTVEEHTILGGLGSAVCEVLAETVPVPVMRVGLRDQFAETGPYEEMLAQYGMCVEDVISSAKRAIGLRCR